MRNVRIVLFAVVIATSILACGSGGAPSLPSADSLATAVAGTMQALTPQAPAATEAVPSPEPEGIQVTYKNVSFTIPTGLAGDAAPETVPARTDENGGPWGAGPEHIEFRLDNYRIGPDSFAEVNIAVYPAQEYANANTGANISLQRLQAALSSGSAPLNARNVPEVPSFNAAAMIAAQIQPLDFKNGHGLRLVTQYGQAAGPITNNGTFYNFQGLTSDGKYYIIAVLPVQSPLLASGQDPNAPVPAGGVPFPGYTSIDPKDYENYYSAVTDKLNASPADQFSPSLAELDAMMQSFSVAP